MGANYGWPDHEGHCSSTLHQPRCTRTPTMVATPPWIGGFVYHGTAFPASYEGSYFFADYTAELHQATSPFDAGGNLTGVFNFEPADGALDGPYGDIVYLIEGPDQNLYYLDLGYSDISGTFGISKLRRIRYVQSQSSSDRRRPLPTSTSGAAPLTVAVLQRRFDQILKVKPLTYSWAFGDNITSTAGEPLAHVHVSPVSTRPDFTGVGRCQHLATSTPITITVGNRPLATIASPLDGSVLRRQRCHFAIQRRPPPTLRTEPCRRARSPGTSTSSTKGTCTRALPSPA